MNLSELEIEFARLDIPKIAYCLQGGLPNESYCISQHNGKWEVYYSERGRKTALKVFINEEEACTYFLMRICRQDF
ncbi:MAG: hypothetical protein FWD25_03020 [Clostridia bacterium]|nr:hypothetical protein [Clostridia bacterium]